MILTGATLTVCGLSLAHSMLYVNALLDDPFISFRYASNLTQGHGLVWNPGERPVEGYTNFPWVMINAAAIAQGIHPLAFSKALGTLALVVLVVIPLTPLNTIHRSLWTRVFTAVTVALAPVIAFYAQSGMETTMFALFVTIAAYGYCRWLTNGEAAMLMFVSLAWLFASLTRPEALGLFVITVAFEVLEAAVLHSDEREGAQTFVSLGTVLPRLDPLFYLAHGLLRLPVPQYVLRKSDRWRLQRSDH
jgi:hypothetical protein